MTTTVVLALIVCAVPWLFLWVRTEQHRINQLINDFEREHPRRQL